MTALTSLWGSTIVFGTGSNPQTTITTGTTRTDLILFWGLFKDATTEFTGLSATSNVGTPGGTWTRLQRQAGTGCAMELWAGWGFNEVIGGSLTIAATAPTATRAGYFAAYRNGTVQDAAPGWLQGGGAFGASGAAADPGGVLPGAASESDNVLFSHFILATGVPTYTATPGGGEAFGAGNVALATSHLGIGRRSPASASEYRLTATTLADWVSIKGLLVPKVVTRSDSVHLYKGRATRSADLAGVL